LLVAACGGDDEGSETSNSFITRETADTSSAAKRGGTMKWFGGSDPANWDFHVGHPTKNLVYALTVGALVNHKAGVNAPPSYEDVAPDIAESWEWSGDKLQVTLKLRSDVKWHDKAPVSGRSFDAEDVLFSWDRFTRIGQQRSLLANAVNPNAPIVSITSPDPRTVVIKLKEPTNYLLPALSPLASGNFVLVPKETDSTYDIQRDVINTGPFILDKYEVGVRFELRRNPEYYDKQKPFLDRLEIAFLPEYAQQLAQFKAGNIYSASGGPVFPPSSNVRPEDVLPVKRESPNLNVFTAAQFGFHTQNTCAFGWLPAGQSPFRDERVRQALSMSYDRDLFIETFNNVSKFEAEGVPMDATWYTTLGPAPGWRLDPKSKDFGPNAKYYEYNLDEAKKLLAAAGYPNGLDVRSHYVSSPSLGGDPDFQKSAQVRDGMAAEAGFRTSVNILDPNTIPQTYNSGEYEGWYYRSGRQGAEDAVSWLEYRYRTNAGPGFLGFDVKGIGDKSGDPEVDSLISKARGELDANKRRAIVHDIERYLAKAMYTVNIPGIASNIQMAWPALQNFLVFHGDRRSTPFAWWLDETQPPFNKS
jgi:peptide/nickel transport system substrate-binding protein